MSASRQPLSSMSVRYRRSSQSEGSRLRTSWKARRIARSSLEAAMATPVSGGPPGTRAPPVDSEAANPAQIAAPAIAVLNLIKILLSQWSPEDPGVAQRIPARLWVNAQPVGALSDLDA